MGHPFALRIVLTATLSSACTPHPNGRGCPAGAYRETGKEEAFYAPVRCVRANGVPDGPFLFHDFDEVRRTWSTRTGNYSEGELDGDVIVRDSWLRVTRVETYARGQQVAVARYQAKSVETRETDGTVRLDTFVNDELRESRTFACSEGIPLDVDGDPRPPAATLELCAP